MSVADPDKIADLVIGSIEMNPKALLTLCIIFAGSTVVLYFRFKKANTEAYRDALSSKIDSIDKSSHKEIEYLKKSQIQIQSEIEKTKQMLDLKLENLKGKIGTVKDSIDENNQIITKLFDKVDELTERYIMNNKK